jgi:hypothetical protein
MTSDRPAAVVVITPVLVAFAITATAEEAQADGCVPCGQASLTRVYKFGWF